MLSKGFMTLRLLSTSRSLCIREIIKNEDGKTITFEGLRKASPRTKKLIDPNILNKACCHESTECHPLCRFEKVHEIKHTDVLILDQFVDGKGEIINRNITGLCERQHYRMDKLIGMAQKANLMGSKDKFAHEKVSKPWATLNSYWDESTIDVQWSERQKRKSKPRV